MYISYHILFIHSLVDEHLGHFHLLAIVNSAAVNIDGHIFVCILSVPFRICLGVELLGNTMFNFLKTVLYLLYVLKKVHLK